MEVAFIILMALLAVGIVLYVHHRLTGGDSTPQAVPEQKESERSNHGAFCCGTHIVCEKGLPADGEIIYYDDEELDAFSKRNPEEYTDAEIEQFRDVLYTLLPTDIAGWNHSLQLREIDMPQVVRDEMLLIVSEARQSLASNED